MSSTILTRLQNQLYFNKRRILVSSGFVALYAGTCYSALNWKNDVMRMGVAGSLANLLVESKFHFIDTVNIRAKAMSSGRQATLFSLVDKIWQKVGLYGFG